MSNLETMFPLTISNSSLSTFQSCELKGFRANIQHLKGVNSNPDLLAGGIFAKACEIARKTFYNEGFCQEEAIARGVEYILNSESIVHTIKTNERVAYNFEKYIETFPFNRFFKPCTLSDGSHAVEFRFELDTGIQHPDFPSKNILFTGFLDGLYEQVVDDKVVGRYVLDEKTTSRISRIPGTKIVDLEKEADNFRASGQLVGYAVAAENLGISITGGLIRRIPLLKNYEPAFELEIPITRFMKDQWIVSTFSKIEELVEKYKIYKKTKPQFPHGVFFPTYGTSCHVYNRTCPFIEGCLTKDGETVLATTHKQEVSFTNKDGERKLISLHEVKKTLNK